MTRARAAVLITASALSIALSPIRAEEVTKIELNEDLALTVEQDLADRRVRIAISDDWAEWISVGVGNAGFTADTVQLVKFCAQCEPAYFIPVWDASSTYGAITGILAYSLGENAWSLSILPMSRPSVEDDDGDGIFVLMDHPPNGIDPEAYEFDRGMLSEKR